MVKPRWDASLIKGHLARVPLLGRPCSAVQDEGPSRHGRNNLPPAHAITTTTPTRAHRTTLQAGASCPSIHGREPPHAAPGRHQQLPGRGPLRRVLAAALLPRHQRPRHRVLAPPAAGHHPAARLQRLLPAVRAPPPLRRLTAAGAPARRRLLGLLVAVLQLPVPAVRAARARRHAAAEAVPRRAAAAVGQVGGGDPAAAEPGARVARHLRLPRDRRARLRPRRAQAPRRVRAPQLPGRHGRAGPGLPRAPAPPPRRRRRQDPGHPRPHGAEAREGAQAARGEGQRPVRLPGRVGGRRDDDNDDYDDHHLRDVGGHAVRVARRGAVRERRLGRRRLPAGTDAVVRPGAHLGDA
jgi:hypothetical protein